jgi:hypothetical protein
MDIIKLQKLYFKIIIKNYLGEGVLFETVFLNLVPFAAVVNSAFSARTQEI